MSVKKILTSNQRKLLITNLINRVKVYNIPIILCGHYPIKPEFQKMVDYCIYDKNNDILEEKDFEENQRAQTEKWKKELESPGTKSD